MSPSKLPGGAPFVVAADVVANYPTTSSDLAYYVDRTHGEFAGNNTANPSAITAIGNWVMNAANSWGPVASINGASLAVAKAGLHAVQVSVRFGAIVTGRAYAEIQVGGVLVARAIGGQGDEQLSVAVPNLLIIPGNGNISVSVFQTNAAAQSVFATARITRLGSGKPT